jgi:phasin
MADVAANPKSSKSREVPVTSSPSISAGSSFDQSPFVNFPILFRSFSERSAENAKENWQTMKSAAEKLNAAAQESYSTTSQESFEYANKVMEIASSNVHAAVDLADVLIKARTASEIFEVCATHARQQMEQSVAQNRQLWTVAQKLLRSMAAPLKAMGLTETEKEHQK